MRGLAVLAVLAMCCVPWAHGAARFQLQYRGYAWSVFPLGEAALDVSVRPDAYRAAASLRSGGFLRLFDQTDLKASADGGMDSAGPRWTDYDLKHNYAKKHRETVMHADAGGVTTQITPFWHYLGSPPVTEEQKRAARDPLSSIIAMGVDIARTRNCGGVYSTFDGRFLYEIRFLGGKNGSYHTDGYDGPVLKCTVNYVPVAGYEPNNKKQSRKKFAKAELWFALPQDGSDFAAPVRAALPLGLGEAHLTLTQWRRVQVNVDDGGEAAGTTVEPPPS